jgi:acetyl esterase/lipase
MQRIVILLAMTLIGGQAADPKTAPRPEPILLWPGGAPGALGTAPEDIPTISIYRPRPPLSNGAIFVVCPGGGYGRLADHEGHDVAVWLNGLGVTAGVLRYRLGPRYNHPAPSRDVARAIRFMRARAKDWDADPARLGIIGFSAGGHLASTIATRFDRGDPRAADPIDRMSSRPDVAILAYPVISMDQRITHTGSRNNLLGPNPPEKLVEELSSERHVTHDTPPTFLFHTADDEGVPVENSDRFAAALRAAKVPFELHVFEKGRHGVGLAPDDPVLKAWPQLAAAWLRARGIIR